MKLRKTLRIARWEVSKSAGTVDRTTIAFALAILVVGALTAPAIVSSVSLDEGIYRVGVDEDSEYYDVVQSTETLVAGSPDGELGSDVSLQVDDGQFRIAQTRKGAAAYDEFRTAVRRYNDRLMLEERNAWAAFPVRVSLSFVERESVSVPGADGDTGAPTDGDGSGDETGDDGTGDGSNTGGDGTDDSGADDVNAGAGDTAGDGDDGRVRAPAVGGGGGGSDAASGAPGSLSPPFPFESLVLAFLFIVPMNFVIQAYGSTIINERVKRRGELMLVAPVTRADIIAGKTLPYFAGLVAVCAVIAVFVGGTAASIAAVVPIACLFLAASFVGGMFARSFKELTFVTIAVSVFLTAYVFVPAIFADITPIALISPLTLVVRDLRGAGFTLVEYAYSTGPFYLSSLVLFAIGASVYREEDMFTQKPLPAKALDAAATFVRSYRSIFLVPFALLPFVFVAELLVIALLVAIPPAFALPVLLTAIAVVEEFAKSIGAYAGFSHDRFPNTNRAAVAVGIASGLGFFIAEKATLVVQLVGMGDVRYGQAAFQTVPSNASPLVVLGLLFLPLALHVVTATISALGARRGRTAYGVAFTIAVFVHLGYNAGVLAGV